MPHVQSRVILVLLRHCEVRRGQDWLADAPDGVNCETG